MSLKGRQRWLGAGLAAVGTLASLKWLGLSGEVPVRALPVASLPGCASSPNCVSSGAGEDSGHAVAAFEFHGDAATSLERIKTVVLADGGAWAAEDARYVRFEYRSRVFGFVDDVEFLLRPEAGRIEVRSASRVGYSDLGVNRRRIERLRARLSRASGSAA